jgi:hypothetical protein
VNIAIVSEGETEYFCVPKLVGRQGHVVVSNVHVGGCAQDWEYVLRSQLTPYVRTAALKQPDKIIVVVDREDREDCCPNLAQVGLDILNQGLAQANLTSNVALVVSDRRFESIVLADYDLVDTLGILQRPVSLDFGATLDGKNPKAILDRALKPGAQYHKVKHGGYLASRMALDEGVLSRSRSLQKLIKEVPNALAISSGRD